MTASALMSLQWQKSISLDLNPINLGSLDMEPEPQLLSPDNILLGVFTYYYFAYESLLRLQRERTMFG